MVNLGCLLKGHFVITEDEGFYNVPKCNACGLVLPTLFKDIESEWFELYEPTYPIGGLPDNWYDTITIEHPCSNLSAVLTQERLDAYWEDLRSGYQDEDECCDSGKSYRDCCHPAKRIPTK